MRYALVNLDDQTEKHVLQGRAAEIALHLARSRAVDGHTAGSIAFHWGPNSSGAPGALVAELTTKTRVQRED
ncbi:MAG: hypothetical protein U0821_18685 [Chloroflexota bacterium]